MSFVPSAVFNSFKAGWQMLLDGDEQLRELDWRRRYKALATQELRMLLKEFTELPDEQIALLDKGELRVAVYEGVRRKELALEEAAAGRRDDTSQEAGGQGDEGDGTGDESSTSSKSPGGAESEEVAPQRGRAGAYAPRGPAGRPNPGAGPGPDPDSTADSDAESDSSGSRSSQASSALAPAAGEKRGRGQHRRPRVAVPRRGTTWPA